MDKETPIRCKVCDWEGKAGECVSYSMDLEFNPDDKLYCPNCGSSELEKKEG